jgi:hypothetical protein
MPVRRNSDYHQRDRIECDEVVGDGVLCPACHDKFFRYGLRAGMLMLLIDALVFSVVPTRNVRTNSEWSSYFADLSWHIESMKQSFAR